MRARDLMTSPAVTVTAQTSVKTAEDLLAWNRFTALPVLDSDERLAGIVTEVEIVANRLPPEPQPIARLVADIMRTDVGGADIGIRAADLAQLMLDKDVRSIPIVDRGRVVGVVSRQDFVRLLARADDLLADDVRRRLALLGGAQRWTVEVHDGEATILDRCDDEEDHQVAVVVAEGVPGVIRAR